MNLRLIGLLALLALGSGAGWQGYRWGQGDCQASHNADRLARIEAGRVLEAARIAAVQERDALARQLEEAAHAEPVTTDNCLGAGRVRRLNQLR